MKKMKTMRAAALLLALTLITSCFVGGTFAKYTTSSSGEDSARVAYWGFNDDGKIEIENLFSNDYGDVKSTDDVIAPGTEGSATFTFAYSGTKTAPEVDYKITVTTTDSTNTLSNTNIRYKLDDGNWGTWDQLLTAIQNLSITDGKANVAPTGFTKDETHTVSWVWAFDANDNTVVTDAADTDTTDTSMGNAASAVATLKIQITAEQVNAPAIP